MDAEQAKQQFQSLLSSLRKSDIEEFLSWTKDTSSELLENLQDSCSAMVILDNIREDLRRSMPIECVADTENITIPTVGKNATCDPATTVHVDAFLYDDDTLDDLCEDGRFSRNYCTQCLSKVTRPLNFITHSVSVPQMKYMFQYLLKDLRNKTVLDVGSRTGALLYGAHLYTQARCIRGVEIDPTFCALQNKVIEKYNMLDRIQIIHSDINAQTELLQTSDVVILNNVFEFFTPVDQQLRLWRFLYEILRKKDTILITIPSIQESLTSIKAPFDQTGWLQPVDISDLRNTATVKLFSDPEDCDLNDVHMYTVL